MLKKVCKRKNSLEIIFVNLFIIYIKYECVIWIILIILSVTFAHNHAHEGPCSQCLRAEWSSWDVGEEKFREIIREGACKEIRTQHKQLELNARIFIHI